MKDKEYISFRNDNFIRAYQNMDMIYHLSELDDKKVNILGGIDDIIDSIFD